MKYIQALYEVNITLMPKPDTDVTERENYKAISPVNIDANILNTIWINQIQEHTQKISIHHSNKVGYIIEIQE